jgi:hypothetical protein
MLGFSQLGGTSGRIVRPTRAPRVVRTPSGRDPLRSVTLTPRIPRNA